jgi:hypothetical protein
MKAKSSVAQSVPSGTKAGPVQELLSEMSLADRMRPVLVELLWVVQGAKEPHEKILPAYCYRIFEKFRRTYFQELPPLSSGQDAPSEMGWSDLGRVVGLGLRCLRFGEAELEEVLSREASIDGENLTATLASLFAATEPKSDVAAVKNENEKSALTESADAMWKVFLQCNQAATLQGTDSFAKFNRGAIKGAAGFVDNEGRLVGETSRANVYWFLLLAWPEIKEMQEAHPGKTRNDFYEWVKPLAACGFVSLHSLGQLVDVSNSIGLKFARRGAPTRKK